MVFNREMRSEETDRRQCQRSIFQAFQDHWEAACGTRRFDPVVRCAFGEIQRLRAVGEQGRIPFAEIQAPCIELHQRSNQHRGCASLSRGKPLHFRDELVVG